MHRDNKKANGGAQWLNGRVLDSGSKGCGFEPQRQHCVVTLRKKHKSLLSTGSYQENPSQHDCKK